MATDDNIFAFDIRTNKLHLILGLTSYIQILDKLGKGKDLLALFLQVPGR